MNLFKFMEYLYIANQSASFEHHRILTTPYEVGRNQVRSGDKKISGKTCMRRTSRQVFDHFRMTRVDLALSIKQQDQIIAELHNYTNYCTENDEFIVQLYGYCKLTKHLIV